jgi:predicted dehydrogenase
MRRRDLLASLLVQPPIGVGFLGSEHSHFAGKKKVFEGSPAYKLIGVTGHDDSALLDDPAVQLIVVECPIEIAIRQGRKVIAAGKHLHLEKPPGNQLGPFVELVEEARRKQLHLQTGYVWRWHAGISAALEAARRGWLGDVFLVRGTMNADRTPAQRLAEARFGGGAMFELGGHMIDRAVDLLGRPKSVKPYLRHDSKSNDKLADNTLAVLEFDRALAVLTVADRMAGSGQHRSFEVLGEDGSFIVYPERNPPTMSVHMRRAQGPYRAGWQEITLPPQPRFMGDFEEMARSIRTNTPLTPTYDHEILLQETLLRASGELL